eukprot:gene9838-biopygen3250
MDMDGDRCPHPCPHHCPHHEQPQTRPDQTRPDQTRPYQTSETQPDQTRHRWGRGGAVLGRATPAPTSRGGAFVNSGGIRAHPPPSLCGPTSLSKSKCTV